MEDTDREAPFTIRPAEHPDIREVAALWVEAFPGGRTVDDRVRMLETGGRYGGLETVLVLRGRGGALAGAAKVYRLESHIAGVPFPMMGLAAVAVAPAFRRRGLGARLCTEAISVAAGRGDILSVLYPFRPDYYERLGWGLVGELHDYRFHTAGLPRYEEARHVRRASGEADRAAIAASYARVAVRSNGPIVRDDRVWAYRLAAEELGVRPLEGEGVTFTPTADPKLRAVVYDHAGVTGYALLRHVSGRDRDRKAIEVRELVAESEAAYRGLLGHVAAHSERWPRARHFARPEERFGDRLTDPRPPGHSGARSLYFPTARIVQGPMLRVLDLPGALRRRRWFDAEEGRGGGAGQRVTGSLRIHLRDPQRPENEGPWMIRVDSSGGGVPAVAAGDPPIPGGGVDALKGEIHTDAATFARIFCGEISVTDAGRLGAAEVGGDPRFMDRAFATRERFWLLDEF